MAIVLLGGAEWIAESIPNSYTYKRDYMEAHGSSVKTLILGSSNAYDGLNPSELPAAFNLANSSQTIEDDMRLLGKYIDGMDSLETVIVGLGYHSLGEAQETHRRTYYTIYMDLYPRWPINRHSLEVFDLRLLTKKIIKYAASRDVTRCDSLGQRLGHTRAAAESGDEWWNKDVAALADNDRWERNINPDKHSCAAINKEETKNTESTVADSNLQLSEGVRELEEMAEMCSARGVQLVVVQMPVMKEYKEMLPKEQVMIQDSVLRALEGKAVYIDASEWEIPADGWYNATHLTREASVEFTKRIKENIASL